jgi:hypothetical protein
MASDPIETLVFLSIPITETRDRIEIFILIDYLPMDGILLLLNLG